MVRILLFNGPGWGMTKGPSIIRAIFLFFLWAIPSPAMAQKAFPSAEGYGAMSEGGRGGRVLFVTNLEDSGPGSLRHALSVEKGRRTIIFRIAGIIELDSNIYVRGEGGSYVTIAGQTAPGDGIILKNYGIFFKDGAHDIVIRHLRVRPGKERYDPSNPNGIDGIAFYGSGNSHVYNGIVDRSSISWATDENINLGGGTVDNITIQWSTIVEGAKVENNGSYGFLAGYSRGITATLHHNLFAHNSNRNPAFTEGKRIDIRNNVIYNWTNMHGLRIGHYVFQDPIEANVVGNYFLPGPQGGGWVGTLGVRGTRVFLNGNTSHRCQSPCDNPWNLGFMEMNLDVDPSGGAIEFNPRTIENKYAANEEFDVPPVGTDTADVALARILEQAGATIPVRDAVDERIISEVMTGTGSQGIGSDYPELKHEDPIKDSDEDGMPDDWESLYGLDPQDSNDRNGDFLGNGYTNLEDYLNYLAGDVVPNLLPKAVVLGETAPVDDIGSSPEANFEQSIDSNTSDVFEYGVSPSCGRMVVSDNALPFALLILGLFSLRFARSLAQQLSGNAWKS